MSPAKRLVDGVDQIILYSALTLLH